MTTIRDRAQGVVNEFISGDYDPNGLRDLIQIAITAAMIDAYSDAIRLTTENIEKAAVAFRARQLQIADE